jgi:hypothetical protein
MQQSAGEPKPRTSNGNSFNFSTDPQIGTDTKRVGKRFTKDVMLDGDYGYMHKDSKNKALTVNLREVHNPGHGRNGDLSGSEFRYGLTNDDFEHKNIKNRDPLSSYAGVVHEHTAQQYYQITGLPSENPYNAAPASAYFPGKQRDLPSDPTAISAARIEPNVVPGVLPAAPSLENAKGLDVIRQPKQQNANLATNARSNFEKKMESRRSHK